MVIFFVVLGVLLLLTLVAYIVSLCKGQTAIVKSTVVSGPVSVEADQTYYLPAHSMTIKATALVQVAKSADKVIQGGTLLQLSLEPAVTIEPDTSALVTLRYKEDWFSNDAIELGTTAKGLLENISLVAEDRLTQIVAQITGAVEPPADKAGEARGLVRRPKDILVTEIVEYTRTFNIGVREAAEAEISRPWVLPFKGQVAPGVEPIDATITFRCKTNKTTPPSLNGLKFDGLLTRPLVEQTWEATAEGLRDLVSFTCLVPNRYSVVKVPMRRSYFIRREQQPKFSDGLLLQNKIVKPSEAEALIGIPIRIAKAVFSIPAQLFQFKITQARQETEFAKALQELAKAQAGTPVPKPATPSPAKTPGPSAQDNAGIAARQDPGQDAAQEQLPPLGKKPATKPSAVARRMPEIREKMRNFRARAEAPAAAAEQEIPESHFWTERFNGPWKPYRNVIGGIKDCVPAAAAHMITSWSSYTNTTAIEIEEDDVIATYTREAGYDPATGDNDDGCTLSTFMDNWISEGVGGRQIRDFVLLRNDRDEIKLAIYWFGPCIIGLKMPQTAQLQPQQWQVVDGDATHSSEPDTWGGHAVAAVGYDAEGLLVISWGKAIRMDWDFFQKYNDESYAALSADWLVKGKQSPPPAGKLLADLQNTMQTLQLT